MDALQITGGIILCAGYIPQIRRILVSRSAHDLSLSMWVSVLIGLILMEAYAVYLFATSGGPAVLITNSVSLAFAIGMVVLILIFGSRPTFTLAATEEILSEELVLSPVEGAQAA